MYQEDELTKVSKNIFYYTNAQIFDNAAGITKKVKSQIQAFRKLGCVVTYSAYLEDGVGIFDNDDNLIVKKKYSCQNTNMIRYMRRGKLIRFVTKYLDKKQYDLIYIRYHYFDGIFYKLIKKSRDVGQKITLELHCYPCLAFTVSKMLPVFVLDKLWEKRCAEQFDQIAAMVNDETLLGKPIVQIFNGISLENISVRSWNKPQDKNLLRMIAVSYEADCHGYDRLIKGIEDYKQKGGILDFSVCLVGTYLNSTIDLIDKSDYKQYFKLVGKKYGQELDDLYNNADLAIGTLALHRRAHNTSSSTLKLPEYLAKGIPCIYAGEDIFLNDEYPYALRIKDDESNISMDEIILFYEKFKDLDNLSTKIRESVSAYEYTWEYQMEKVLNA